MPAPASTMRRVVSPIGEILLREEDGKTISDFHILRAGDWVHEWYGDMHIDETTFDEMLANFDGPGRRPIDYNHGSAHPSTPEEGKAAGWIQSLTKRGADDLWAVVEWTQKAVEYITAGEYKFASAQFDLNARSEHEPPVELGAKLWAVALCIQPWIPGLTPVALAAGVEIPVFYRPAKPSPRRTAMNEVRIREILGLSAGIAVTEEHQRLALAKMDEMMTEAQGHMDALMGLMKEMAANTNDAEMAKASKPDEFTTIAASRIIVPKTEHTRLLARAAKADELERTTDGKILLTAVEHADLKAGAAAGAQAAKELHENKVTAAIDDAIRLRKVLPVERPALQKTGLRDLAELTAMLAARPENMVLPKGERGSDTDPTQAMGAQVDAFLLTRETELVKEGQSRDRAYSLAIREARAKFSRDVIQAWEYRPLDAQAAD